jgi:hypothetical protein
MSRDLIAAILQLRLDAIKAQTPPELLRRIILTEQTDALLKR